MIIKLNKSYVLSASVIVVFLTPAFSIFWQNWAVWFESVIAALLMCAGAYQAGRYGLLLSGKSVIKLAMEADRLSIGLKASPDRLQACDIDRFYVGRHIVIARLIGSHGREKISLPLIRGMCTNNEFRQLKKWLRTGKALGSTQSPGSASGTSTVSRGAPPAGPG